MNTNISVPSDHFLQAVLEGFVDGILVLTEEYKVLYANATAHSVCDQLVKNPAEPLPKEVYRACQALIESRELYPNYPITIESEVSTLKTTFRIRAQWLTFDAKHPYLLLRLQDENQSVQGLAIAEAQKWGLTARETEVWLLRRAGCSRKTIAAELYIALDTVKKHLKNIHLKRQAVLDEEEWQAHQAS